MSAQIALMAGTAALGAFSSIAGGSAQASAYGAQADMMKMQGIETDVQAAEVRAQAQNEELQRRKGLLKLLSGNRADLAGRNVSGEQGSSFDVIQGYNEDEAARDIGNIRFMGESKVQRLSFAKAGYEFQASQYMNMAGMARMQGWLGAAKSLGMAGYSMFGGVNSGAGSSMTSTRMGGPDGYGGLG